MVEAWGRYFLKAIMWCLICRRASQEYTWRSGMGLLMGFLTIRKGFMR